MKLNAAALLLAFAGLVQAQSGRELVEESLQRYAQPAQVYEEHALVMTDRQGQHTVRTARYYAQHDENGRRNLHLIASPAELKGASIFVQHGTAAALRRGVAASSPVFGTNFLVADLEGEQSSDFLYERESDQDIERIPHFVIRAKPVDSSVVRATSYHERRLYLRKDNLYISRIDYQDREGRPARRLRFRDPRPDEAGIWRAGMMLMEDLRDGRRTLLKVEHRVHSPDYVPTDIFAKLQVSR